MVLLATLALIAGFIGWSDIVRGNAADDAAQASTHSTPASPSPTTQPANGTIEIKLVRQPQILNITLQPIGVVIDRVVTDTTTLPSTAPALLDPDTYKDPALKDVLNKMDAESLNGEMIIDGDHRKIKITFIKGVVKTVEEIPEGK
jgi:hypothetical protein